MESTTVKNSAAPPISAWSDTPSAPEYPHFQPLTAAHDPLIREHLARQPRPICEWALANLIAWQDCENPTFTTVHGNLCIHLAPHASPPYFLEPLGDCRLAETVLLCLEKAGRLSRVSSAFLKKLPSDLFQITPLPDQFDYIYETARLAEMKGKKFDGKRNQIKKFQRQHPDHRFRPLLAGDGAAALDLFARWFVIRERGNGAARFYSPASYECQKAALSRAFEQFASLRLVGGAMEVAGRLEGFILGSPLTPEMFAAHFEYAHPDMPGIYQLLLREACRTLFPSYPLLNLEQDLGIPGLRETKNSYQPLRQEEKFEVSLR